MKRLISLGAVLLLFVGTACGGNGVAPGTDGGTKGDGGGGSGVISVTISNPANGDSFAPGQTITFTGSATDTRSNTAISNSNLVWTSNLGGQIGIGGTVRSALQQGTHTITLTATASDGTSGTASITISVATPPLTVTITRPSNRDIFPSGQSIQFNCQVQRGGQNVPGATIDWTTEAGKIGSGAQIQTAVPDGQHTVTCTASDPANGDTGSDSINITVGAPAIHIDRPLDGQQFTFGNTITFRSTVISNDPAPYLVKWTSDVDGQLGTGQNIQTALSTAGTHNITASFTNTAGVTVTDTISLSYIKPNQPPVVTITSPATDGTSVTAGSPIDLTGTAIDPEDGDITASGTWFDPVAGNLGTGGSAQITSPLPGKYAVTFSATDSAGATTSATRIIYVTPAGGGQLAQTQLNGTQINGVFAGGGANGMWISTSTGYTYQGTVAVNLQPGDVSVAGTPTSVSTGGGVTAFGATQGLSVCVGGGASLGACTSYTDQLRNAVGTSHVNSVLALPDGTVIAATDNGLFVISPNGSTSSYDGGNWNGSDQVNALAYDASTGLVYMATNRGLVTYDPTTGQFQAIPRDGLPTSTLTCVAARNGQVWVGYHGGIAELTQPGNNWTTFRQNAGLTNTEVTSIALDSAGIVWGGTNGGGAFRLDQSVGRFLMITTADGLPSNTVTSTYIDGSDVKYFGTPGGLGVWYGQ